MGNAYTQLVGNPDSGTDLDSHDPLVLQELEREATLNPLPLNILFERLSSAADASKSADETAENEGDAPTEEPTETGSSSQENAAQSSSHDKENTDGCHDDKDRDSHPEDKYVEQLMHLAVPIPREFQHQLSSGQQCHVILVADCSGSMAGSIWNQVKEALVNIVGASLHHGGLEVDILTYNNRATQVQFTPDNYKFAVSRLLASGSTSFVAAMNKVDEIMKQKKNKRLTSTAVMFMTDGQDTVSKAEDVRKHMEKWKTTLQAYAHEVTIHAVGFSKDHDFEFLRKLAEVGSKPGLFRYCEPGDGVEVLKVKMEELFEYAVYSSQQVVDFTVQMNGKNRILGSGAMLSTQTVQGEVIRGDPAASGDQDAKQTTLKAEMWVRVADAAELPSPVVSLNMTVPINGRQHTIKLPCTCAKVEEKIIEDAAEKAVWGINILSRNTDVLATEIANAIQEKKDATVFQKRLTRLQNRLSNTKVFGSRINKEARESLLSMMKAAQTKLDVMHGMLAQYSRGETASVSLLARAHDLRYEAQFKKSRRQRAMDKRAVQNVRRAKADEAKLDELEVDEAEIGRLSEEAIGFFFCALSQESVVDILRDLENKENAIGFGLAVCRPEYIVDSPTSLQLCLVSGTLVSRTSMLDALEYKVNLAGQLAAHNGFSFFHRGQDDDGDDHHQGGRSLGYATVGMGREPINAWMPLFVTPSHWNRVKVLMKPTLGYLCTLDPLGFDWAQLDVPFAVLGAMIGQLNKATTGTHQLRLLFCFLRTCVACVDEFNLTNRILNVVRTFLREPAGRFKSVVPNLFTLIGYIAALPVAQSRQIMGYEEEGRDPDQFPRGLWYAFVAEVLRRSAGTLLKASSDQERNILVDLLLHGRKNSLMIRDKGKAASSAAAATAAIIATAKVQEASPCTATATSTTTTAPTPSSSAAAAVVAAAAAQSASDLSQHVSARFTCLCSSMASQSADLTIQGVDDAKGEQAAKAAAVVARPVVKFQHCPKMDSSMEIWARAKLSALENKSQEKRVSESKKQVEQWLKEGRQAAGLSDKDAEEEKAKEEEKYDCDTVDSSVLEVTAKFLSRLSKTSSFPLSSLPGAMAFLHAWMSSDRDLQEMSDGLPPARWIDEIKAAIARVYSDMHGYVTQCQQQVSSDDIEEVVVIEGRGQAAGTSGHHQHGGKRGDDDDDDDDYSSDYDDYADDEDDPMKVLKRRQQEYRTLVTLPMILHALDPCENKVKVTRAMLCQAVIHYSNAAAKDAANEGQFVDLKTLDVAEDLMGQIHRQVVRLCRRDQTSSVIWQRANMFLLSANSIWAFLGYLMNTYEERDEGFSWLLTDIAELGEGSSFPCLADKVRALLTGQWQGHSVVARGNSRMVGPALSKKLTKVLGEDDWLQIDLDLRGSLQIHVYRESDIPNRHGHCNSNPYIPPALRLRLGMPPAGSGK